MDRIENLEDLLVHYVMDLYAAEQQALEAMPSIIEKASHQSLKNALKHHLELNTTHKKRLEQVLENLASFQEQAVGSTNLSSQVLQENHVCKAMAGLLEEAETLIHGNINPAVVDAAIIGTVQKLEHYEICAYGTALAYARELNIGNIAALLTETLDEEYDIDDLLTALATASFNKNAEPRERRKRIHSSTADESQDPLYEGPSSHETTNTNRSLKSPGGRAGTSHRGYPSGESRGH